MTFAKPLEYFFRALQMMALLAFVWWLMAILLGCSGIGQAAYEGVARALADKPPPDITDVSLGAGVASLVTYIIGSLGKGYIRSKLGSGGDVMLPTKPGA